MRLIKEANKETDKDKTDEINKDDQTDKSDKANNVDQDEEAKVNKVEEDQIKKSAEDYNIPEATKKIDVYI